MRTFSFSLCFLLAASASLPAYATEPLYEETVSFVEAHLSKPFVERSKCNFIYADNMRFSMQALNSIPKVNHWNIVLKCAKSKPCIDSRNSNRLATEISIDVPEMKNASKVAKAISHLVMLCGGSKVNSELFE